jgi:lipopolysaccharide heptosyltransferase I
MSEPKRILIIRLSSLGDILHALPAFQSLRAAFPQARIDWLVEGHTAFLLSAIDWIDEILCLDTRTLRKSPLRLEAWQQPWSVIRTLRRKRYDVSLDFQGLIKTGFLAFLAHAPVRIGLPKELVRERPAHWFYNHQLPTTPEPVHVIELNLGLAQLAGGISDTSPVRFKSDPADRREIEAILEREQLSGFIAINPGGGWPTKRWQPGRYAALADRILRELQLRVVVTTGPGEEALYEEVARHCIGAKPVHVHVSFLQLIPLFSRARLVVGGDTGPFHLACALRRPVVGLFGPTSPIRNGPYLNRNEMVYHRLSCSFCYGRTCPTQNECMAISVEEAFEAVVRCLDRTC